MYVVAALYKFVQLPDYVALRDRLYQHLVLNKVKGTLLLAEEGINGTICGPREGIDAVQAFLDADGRFDGLSYKESFADEPAFYRTKVKLKKEIVTMGIDGINPSHIVGTYVKGNDWNELISDPETILIDTRNDYEVAISNGEKLNMKQLSATLDFMPSDFVTFRIEYAYRNSSIPYFTGSGGTTSQTGFSNDMLDPTWKADLVKNENRIILAVNFRL